MKSARALINVVVVTAAVLEMARIAAGDTFESLAGEGLPGVDGDVYAHNRHHRVVVPAEARDGVRGPGAGDGGPVAPGAPGPSLARALAPGGSPSSRREFPFPERP